MKDALVVFVYFGPDRTPNPSQQPSQQDLNHSQMIQKILPAVTKEIRQMVQQKTNHILAEPKIQHIEDEDFIIEDET